MSHRFWWMPLWAGVFGLSLGAAEIPPAKPEGWVVDLAELLSAEDAAEIGRLGDAVHAQGGAEMAILTVGSTRGADPRIFATATFNDWQLGSRERNNGLLIFVAIEDRAVEIVLGEGIDSDAELAKSERILRQTMMPRFRAGLPAAAIAAGARDCAFRIFRCGSAAGGSAASRADFGGAGSGADAGVAGARILVAGHREFPAGGDAGDGSAHRRPRGSGEILQANVLAPLQAVPEKNDPALGGRRRPIP